MYSPLRYIRDEKRQKANKITLLLSSRRLVNESNPLKQNK
tara:strand:+ start:721 stop:840 length:120 start_codon:yes stop_codon:yes gene_type:complete